MRVFKFGGASVKDAEAVKNVASVLQEYGQGPLLVVISAMGKITNKLEELVDAYYFSKDSKKEIFTEIKSFHQEIIDALIKDENDYYEVDNLLIELECIIEKRRDESSTYDMEYDKIVPPQLHKVSEKNDWFKSANLIEKSEKYSLPQTALNWRFSILLALLMCILGDALLTIAGRKSNV